MMVGLPAEPGVNMTKEELKKAAQVKLAEARKCLEEAAGLAEQGGFNISFRGGGTYVPSAAFDMEIHRRDAREMLEKEEPTRWAAMTEDERLEEINAYAEDWAEEMRPYYACEPGWWQPSRNC